MVEVMKKMATSFERSPARTATLSAPDPEADHSLSTPLLETFIYTYIYVCIHIYTCVCVEGERSALEAINM